MTDTDITLKMNRIVDCMDEDIPIRYSMEEAEEYLSRIAKSMKLDILENRFSKIPELWANLYRTLTEFGIPMEEDKRIGIFHTLISALRDRDTGHFRRIIPGSDAYTDQQILTLARSLIEQHLDSIIDSIRELIQNSGLLSRRNLRGMETCLIQVMLKQFMEYPTPTSFMETLVGKLSDPSDGWQNDTLRLQILKQFIKYGNYLIPAGYSSHAFIRDYAVSAGADNTNLTDDEVIRFLDDGIFDTASELLKKTEKDTEQKIKAIREDANPVREQKAILETDAAGLKKELTKITEQKKLQEKQLKKHEKALTAVIESPRKDMEALEDAEKHEKQAAERLHIVQEDKLRNPNPEAAAAVSQCRSEWERRARWLNDVRKREAGHAAQTEELKLAVKDCKVRLSALNDSLAPLQTRLDSLNTVLESLKECLKRFDNQIENQKKRVQDLKKTDGRLGLLCLADDLANGQFKSGGNTRKGLYLFAVVYGMKYGAADPADRFRDVEKNLFRDYYCNNLTRYFSSQAQRNNPSAYEDQPNGQGINFKNYTEAVYLYYLNRPGLTPLERLEKAESLLTVLKKKGPAKSSGISTTEEHTVYFRSLLKDRLLVLPEDQLEGFLSANYTLDTFDRDDDGNAASNKINPIMISAEQNTAYSIYKDLCGKIPDEAPQALTFAEQDHFRERLIDEIMPGMEPSLSPESADDFILLLKNFNRFAMAKTSAVKSPRKMTRTALLTAFHGYFNAEADRSGGDSDNPIDSEYPLEFREFFDLYAEKVNPLLEKAWYQPLSPKIIFDVMLVFSSYYNIYFA